MLTPLVVAQIAAASVGPAKIEIFGTARADAIVEDSRTNDIEHPTYVLSERKSPNSFFGLNGSNPDGNGYHSMHARLSRLGARLGAGRVHGLIELDFAGGGDASMPGLRLRQAYVEMALGSVGGGDLTLLAGQTWDVVGPLLPSVNADSFMWNAGNLGAWRPQLRLTWVHDWMNVAIAATQAGTFDRAGLSPGTRGGAAIPPGDLDGNGIPDGVEAGQPGWQGRIGADTKMARLGLWGFVEAFKTRGPGNASLVRTGFRAFGYGGDFEVPLYRKSRLELDGSRTLRRSLTLRGEAWIARDGSDLGGGIGQGVAPSGDYVTARGGWVELPFMACSCWTVAPGFTMDDPFGDVIEQKRRGSDLNPGRFTAAPRELNVAYYVANRFNLGDGVSLGLDFIRWNTTYGNDPAPGGKHVPAGADNRFNLWLAYTP